MAQSWRGSFSIALRFNLPIDVKSDSFICTTTASDMSYYYYAYLATDFYLRKLCTASRSRTSARTREIQRRDRASAFQPTVKYQG